MCIRDSINAEYGGGSDFKMADPDELAGWVARGLRVGAVVLVRGSFGTGAPKEATVTVVSEDIKRGIPGIGYTVHGEEGEHWAYLNQVVRLVSRKLRKTTKGKGKGKGAGAEGQACEGWLVRHLGVAGAPQWLLRAWVGSSG
eukprot:TRINITY_DN2744_c0_g1_i1.p2 TRINITY_DN2744_c0_g1~~TRINITY_DN2744_c0_g1_i1.p2  ORF type:complete len:142 (-),score=36.43 TRINITY_DN2744_c0_g1_i1:174-599(-)